MTVEGRVQAWVDRQRRRREDNIWSHASNADLEDIEELIVKIAWLERMQNQCPGRAPGCRGRGICECIPK